MANDARADIARPARRRLLQAGAAAIAALGAIPLSVALSGRDTTGTSKQSQSGFDFGRLSVGLPFAEATRAIEAITSLEVGLPLVFETTRLPHPNTHSWADTELALERATARTLVWGYYHVTAAFLTARTWLPGHRQTTLGRPPGLAPLEQRAGPVHRIQLVAHLAGLGLRPQRAIDLATSRFGTPTWRIDLPRSGIGLILLGNGQAREDLSFRTRTDKIFLAWGGLQRPEIRDPSLHAGINRLEDSTRSILPGEMPGKLLQLVVQDGEVHALALDMLDTADAVFRRQRTPRSG